MAYGRQFEITVNCTDGETIHITDVDVDFSSVRDDEKEPNEAELTLWGLTPQTQNAIAQAGSTVSVAAGYIDEGMFTLFQGELISAVTIKPNEVYGLKMKIYEALIPFRASVTSRIFRKGQNLREAVLLVASDMGLGCQVSKAAAALVLPKNISGVALSRDVLNSLCKPVNATWSIQYQSIVVTAGDSVLNGAAIFSPETGLLGAPFLKIHSPKRTKKKNPSEKDQIQKKHDKSITTYQWPPKGSQVDYSKGARRQMGVIEAITWESLLRGGVEIGEQIELTSPSMGEGWNIIVKKISHRFSTRDRQTWSTSWEGIIA
ncbi:TPA_asm: hypothetical protein GNC10_000970 [Salmonella enterica subsp. salamae serovar 42:z:1,5]|uniref:Uncharacterized protein n=1 Tax=Salmonella enterica subsp. salamae serovar 42:z:1,5 TaxID=1967617 RepID=A0A735PXC0_SALER|nr:hypothetical protein [Salmonella enterica subsp. enterica serovar Newport]EAR3125734.1 hypothetical protein [Salmonella enterica]EBK2078265.1 hypothetical protein [Salmonella enterica subsp. enterica serovar Schwarzengrund]EBW5410027.1 hypothetical protein [Salmonella enterica subsp. enterica serovar Bonn]EBX6494026.1 hypothetical protein [Salmonella enterica subsp. enterica serovar Abony]EBX6686258.1 hypothetical protein [Salmonella enterica subsp. salamae serovar Sofia]ECD5711866.1 hypot